MAIHRYQQAYTREGKLNGSKDLEWRHNQDNIRPTEIKVRLLGGKDTGKMATASAATDWKYSLKVWSLQDGKEIVYSVKEAKCQKATHLNQMAWIWLM